MSLKDHFYRAVMPLLLAACFVSVAVAGWGQSDRSLARKGNELYKRGNYPEAADSYRQAIIRKPDNTLYKYNLGTTLAKAGRTVEAQQTLTEAAEPAGAPRRRDAYYNLGVALGESTQKKDQAPAQPGAAAPGSPPAAPAPPAADSTQVLKEKIATLEQSLGAFRKAILVDAKDDDAKLNYETVLEMLRQARMEQQEQEKQQGKDGKQGNQKQDQQEGQNQGKDQQGDQQNKKNGQKGDSKPQQKPGSQQNGQNGEDDKGEQLKPEQIDALGLLNLLESEKPEQFKQLFRFRGGDSTTRPKRDW